MPVSCVLCLVQVQNLMAMKRAFVSAPEVVGVLVGLLEEPLSKEAQRRGRTEEETLVIELVLTLLRNLLAIQDERYDSAHCEIVESIMGTTRGPSHIGHSPALPE